VGTERLEHVVPVQLIASSKHRYRLRGTLSAGITCVSVG
jgi:hypothetical protein